MADKMEKDWRWWDVSPNFSSHLDLERQGALDKLRDRWGLGVHAPLGQWDGHREVVRLQSSIKLGINNKKATRKSLNAWKLSNTLLNTYRSKKDLQCRFKNILRTSLVVQ